MAFRTATKPASTVAAPHATGVLTGTRAQWVETAHRWCVQPSPVPAHHAPTLCPTATRRVLIAAVLCARPARLAVPAIAAPTVPPAYAPAVCAPLRPAVTVSRTATKLVSTAAGQLVVGAPTVVLAIPGQTAPPACVTVACVARPRALMASTTATSRTWTVVGLTVCPNVFPAKHAPPCQTATPAAATWVAHGHATRRRVRTG